MSEINIYDYDFLLGAAAANQQQIYDSLANTSAINLTGTTDQIVGFDLSGNPTPKNVGGDSNGAGLAFSGDTLTATLPQNLKTTGTPTFQSLTLSGLTAGRMLYSSASQQVAAAAITYDSTLTALGGIHSLDFAVTVNALAAGRLQWDDADGTLALGLKGGNVSLQIGQEEVVRVVNKTGGNLLESEYKVVRISSAQGQRVAVDLAQADSEPNSTDVIGVVTENIAVNQEGFITSRGIVREINTTGSLQGETWADGDVLFLSPGTAGGLTNVKPQGPNHLVIIGYVAYAHANHGKIFVTVNMSWETSELHDVQFGGSMPLAGALLIRDATLNVWKPAQLTAGTNITITNADGAVTIASSGGSGVTNGDKGDITVSNAGTPTENWSIDPNAVTTTKIADRNVTFAKLPAVTASTLLGRGSASGNGDAEEITLGANLTMTGTVLSASGGGGTPGGGVADIQYHGTGGVFAGSSNFQFALTGAPTVSILATDATQAGLSVQGLAAQSTTVVQILQGGNNAAPLLALRQGALLATDGYPLRYENSSGGLLLGLRARPGTPSYQFVSPGAATGTVVYELGTVGSNSGLGVASTGAHPTIYTNNLPSLWFNTANGNTVFNQSYQAAWGSAPGTVDVGITRPAAATLRITDGSTGAGRIQVGGATGTTSAINVGGVVAGSEAQSINASRTTTTAIADPSRITVLCNQTTLIASPTTTATGAVYVAGSNEVRSSGTQSVLTLYGLQNIARHGSTGNSGATVGLKCFAYLDGGTTAELVGGDFQAQTLVTTGVATLAAGVKAGVFRVSATSISTAYGVYVGTVQGTTAYGVYVSSAVAGTTAGGVYVAGTLQNYANLATWTTTSDVRLKKDIIDYEKGLDDILALRPRRFTWNEHSPNSGISAVGFVAQEAQAVDPELVTYVPMESAFDNILGMNVSNITPMLVNAVQTLHARIVELEKVQNAAN